MKVVGGGIPPPPTSITPSPTQDEVQIELGLKKTLEEEHILNFIKGKVK